MPPFKFLILQFQRSTIPLPPPNSISGLNKAKISPAALLIWQKKKKNPPTHCLIHTNAQSIQIYCLEYKGMMIYGSNTSLAPSHSHGLVKWWFMHSCSSSHKLQSTGDRSILTLLLDTMSVCLQVPSMSQANGSRTWYKNGPKKKKKASFRAACAKPTFHSDLPD